MAIPYECIPLWEATSFFHFLKWPSFSNELSFGLYNIVGWTLQSPYTWDPYGLSAKLLPLINSIFRKEYYIPYHVGEIHKLWNVEEEEFMMKRYINAVYEALCILYADRYNVFPPVYMKTLVTTLLENESLEAVFDMIYAAQRTEVEFSNTSKSINKDESGFFRMLQRNEKYDAIIVSALGKAQETEVTNISDEMMDRQVKRICRLIKESVYREQKVVRVSD